MHPVRLGPKNLILAGTRTTYQATEDAGVDYADYTAPIR